MIDKGERLGEFYSRLESAPPVGSFLSAYELLKVTLNAVEDEFTNIPFNPNNWMDDGRLYPPQEDSIRNVPGHENVTMFRSRGHLTYIADNGAIEIQQTKSMEIVFSKHGSNGFGVWQREQSEDG